MKGTEPLGGECWGQTQSQEAERCWRGAVGKEGGQRVVFNWVPGYGTGELTLEACGSRCGSAGCVQEVSGASPGRLEPSTQGREVMGGHTH